MKEGAEGVERALLRLNLGRISDDVCLTHSIGEERGGEERGEERG